MGRRSRIDIQSLFQLARFIVGEVSTEERIVAVEVPHDFFQRCIACLDEEEVDAEQLDEQPAVEDYIILPVDPVQPHGVDVVVEEEHEVQGQEEDCHSLSGLGVLSGTGMIVTGWVDYLGADPIR